MFSINQLCNNTNSTENLDSFIKNNIEGLLSFFNCVYSELIIHRWSIDDCIISSSNSIKSLDFSKYYNSLFLLTFLDYSERFKLQGSFNILYNIAIDNNLKIGHRLDASKIFLLNINRRIDHVNKFEAIVNNLHIAYSKEEDNEVNILVTFGNYISNTIRNTADVDISIIRAVFSKIIEHRNKYSFLSEKFIDKILNINVADYNTADIELQIEIEQLLGKEIEIIYSDNLSLIEEGTNYEKQLQDISANFNSIRSISMSEFNSLSDVEKNKLRNDLLRGVKIIDNKKLLWAYSTLFGNKHKRKLDHAFTYLSSLPIKFNIIDWACGQALASMVFFDYLDRTNINYKINQIILNEPSELALKRAALHINKYNSNIECKTINKDIDTLSTNDVIVNINLPNIHFFSNILDIKQFDIFNLIRLIEKSYSGVNYFICASPYIDDEKKGRIELFVKHFENKYGGNFKLLHASDKRNQDPTWIIRLFKVEL